MRRRGMGGFNINPISPEAVAAPLNDRPPRQKTQALCPNANHHGIGLGSRVRPFIGDGPYEPNHHCTHQGSKTPLTYTAALYLRCSRWSIREEGNDAKYVVVTYDRRASTRVKPVIHDHSTPRKSNHSSSDAAVSVEIGENLHGVEWKVGYPIFPEFHHSTPFGMEAAGL
ncbi:hypothetical protein AVEN_212458-1 [Araneus ventricosus]|uniref:Uncharacterized protein n=1 Tax=Araneus ventricosus TaxID=182803 RepID=A0A4Y2JC83_ARAVE|nr:hypothetical protein AVEN_212458-1 [Araneus ventricosus]